MFILNLKKKFENYDYHKSFKYLIYLVGIKEKNLMETSQLAL